MGNKWKQRKIDFWWWWWWWLCNRWEIVIVRQNNLHRVKYCLYYKNGHPGANIVNVVNGDLCEATFVRNSPHVRFKKKKITDGEWNICKVGNHWQVPTHTMDILRSPSGKTTKKPTNKIFAKFVNEINDGEIPT